MPPTPARPRPKYNRDIIILILKRKTRPVLSTIRQLFRGLGADQTSPICGIWAAPRRPGNPSDWWPAGAAQPLDIGDFRSHLKPPNTWKMSRGRPDRQNRRFPVGPHIPEKSKNGPGVPGGPALLRPKLGPRSSASRNAEVLCSRQNQSCPDVPPRIVVNTIEI